MFRAMSAIVLSIGLVIGCSDEPFDVHKNNPGNIRDVGVEYDGSYSCPEEFLCFESDYYGIRAIGSNLVAYQERHGIDTLEDVIARWMPPNENPTDDLQRTAARLAGSPTLDVAEVAKIIITIEQGGNPYSPGFVEMAVSEFDAEFEVEKWDSH